MSEAPSCALPATNPSSLYGFKAVFGSSPVQGQALALFRIGMAILLLYDLFANVLPTWDFFMTPHGTLTGAERGTVMVWSVLTYSDNPLFQTGFLALYIFSLSCLLVGFRTRFFCFLTLIGYASLVDRNMQNISNVEVLIRGLLLWACFLPMDRYWSIAAALRNDDDRQKTWPIIPILAMKAQIVIVYFYSGLFKLASDDWISGNAIRYAVSDDFFGTELGRRIVALIPESVDPLLCWGIILFQILFSFLVYSRYCNNLLRGMALVGAIVMHLSFLILLQVGIFPFLCTVYLLLLIPDRWINILLRSRREKLSKIRIYYDPDCGFCLKVARILREFCLGNTAPVKPASDNAAALSLLRSTNSWVVYGSDDQTYLKWKAVAYVLRQSPVFWIFGAVTGAAILSRPMERLYDLIGRNRFRLGRAFSLVLKSEPEEWPSVFAQWVCFFCFGVLIVFSTMALPQFKTQAPLQLSAAGHQLGVIQTWDLFAPYVPRWHRTFEITAKDDSGDDVDISHLLSPQYSRDAYGYYAFNGHRYLKFYSRTFEPEEQRNRAGLARYLCYKTREAGQPAQTIYMDHWRSRLYTPTPEIYTYTSSFTCSEMLRNLRSD